MTRSDRTTYRSYWGFLAPYRIRLFAVLAASVATPLVLAARIWLLKVLIDDVLRPHNSALLPTLAAAFLGSSLIRAALDAFKTHASGSLGAQVVRDLRAHSYAKLQTSSLPKIHSRRLGDLLTRVTIDAAAIEDLLVSGLSSIVSYGVTLVFFLVLLVVLNPGLVLVAAAVVPVLTLTTILDARRSRVAQNDLRERTSELTSTAEEGLSAVALVKAFARGAHESARFGDAAHRGAQARLRLVGLRAAFGPLSELVVGIGTAVVVWIGAHDVLSGHLSLGSLVVFLSYLASLYAPIQGLSRLASTLQRATVGAQRIFELLQTPVSASDRGGQALPLGSGGVEFSRISFAYHSGRPVLEGVSFEIESGEMVALVGPSGAGKTTVVSLLMSFYEPVSGRVLIGGHNLARFSADSCRAGVSAVLQEPMLFDTSVRENIRYGRLDASQMEIESAARVAQAHDFVTELPDGYDTGVGPRGSHLSGGQRQRIAIARALVKRAPVLVLDEATSSLDPDTEAMVLGAVREACADRAILLVAHRRSAVRFADRVLRLETGRITAGEQQLAPANRGQRDLRRVSVG
jgi:ABC-type multidrug transport system fused ATPase/permease subunit